MVPLSPNRQQNEIAVFRENNHVSEKTVQKTVHDAALLEERILNKIRFLFQPRLLLGDKISQQGKS